MLELIVKKNVSPHSGVTEHWRLEGKSATLHTAVVSTFDVTFLNREMNKLNRRTEQNCGVLC
jgi:hypothetical protein